MNKRFKQLHLLLMASISARDPIQDFACEVRVIPGSYGPSPLSGVLCTVFRGKGCSLLEEVLSSCTQSHFIKHPLWHP